MTQKFQQSVIKFLENTMPSEFVFPGSSIDADTIKESVKELFETDSTSSVLPHCNHFHDNDCTLPQLLKAVNVIKSTGKLYFVIHLVPLLLFKRKALRRRPFKMAFKLVLGWLRSMVFISSYAFFSRRGWCRAIEPRQIVKSRVFFWSAVASVGLLIEAPNRRAEIAMYVIPRYFESVPKFLGKLGLFPKVPLGVNLLFGLSIAITSYCFFSDQESIKSHMRWLVRSVVGADERQEPAKETGSQQARAAKQA